MPVADKAVKEAVKEWFESLKKFGGKYETTYDGEFYHAIVLYTTNGMYVITAAWPKEDGTGESFLCAIAATKMWEHTDLHGGPVTKETWHEILNDIVAHEMWMHKGYHG